VLERRGSVEVWSDQRIGAGAEWEAEIEAALTASKVAVLLVSPAFLASDFIWKREMPRIIAHSEAGMDVLPLVVRPCAWRLEEALEPLQAKPGDGRALSTGTEGQVDADLTAFTYELAARVGKSPAAPSPAAPVEPHDYSAAPDARLVGKWSGAYNRTRPLCLNIGSVDTATFQGSLEYMDEGTTTAISGEIVTTGTTGDPIWAQLDGGSLVPGRMAITFRETGYLARGARPIDFQGDYRALVTENEMKGAWFSGTRLVGVLALTRSQEGRESP
jgi:hypothetical protein